MRCLLHRVGFSRGRNRQKHPPSTPSSRGYIDLFYLNVLSNTFPYAEVADSIAAVRAVQLSNSQTLTAIPNQTSAAEVKVVHFETILAVEATEAEVETSVKLSFKVMVENVTAVFCKNYCHNY